MTGTTIFSALLVTGLLGLSCAGETSSEKEPQGGSGGGAPDAQVDAALPQCPQGLPGAKLARLSRPDGSSYCIDEREAVNAEYKEFLAMMEGKVIKQPAECAWNSKLTPDLLMPDDDEIGIGKCPVESWKLDSEPSFAVSCVDFCDAWAFCDWAGKRLCGVVGASAGKLDIRPSEADAEKAGESLQSEWFNACSQSGTSKYAYGDAYEPGKCVDPTKLQQQGPSARATKDVALDACHGTANGFREVHHLSGNVWEWVNLCADAGVSCTRQGGARDVALTTDLACDSWGVVATSTISPLYGVRCCADVVP